MTTSFISLQCKHNRFHPLIRLILSLHSFALARG
nr:MAG TPA: hypothetical protein [Caudoviricetes sp.]